MGFEMVSFFSSDFTLLYLWNSLAFGFLVLLATMVHYNCSSSGGDFPNKLGFLV